MNRVLLRVGLSAAAVGAIVAGFGLTAVARDIRRQSQVDEAQPADVIVVLGAAEYRGRPSPVLEARLRVPRPLRRRAGGRAARPASSSA